MAVVRLDERMDTVENVLLSALMDRTDLIPSQSSRGFGVSGDPLASSTWEEVLTNNHFCLCCIHIDKSLISCNL